MDHEMNLDEWDVHLEAARRSPATRKAYLKGVRHWLKWCDREGIEPELSANLARTWVVACMRARDQPRKTPGKVEPQTMLTHLYGLRRYSNWLQREEIIDVDPLKDIDPIKIDTQAVSRLTNDECSALVKACDGNAFSDRRDKAIILLMLDTTLRASEVIGMTVGQTDARTGTAIIMGKGGFGRTVSFRNQARVELMRYLRVRARHPMASKTKALWLGERSSGGIQYEGLARTISKRAKIAGIEDMHLHKLRHTAAQRLLSGGVSEASVMAQAGWKRRDMLDRYTKATAEERAADELRRADLPDF